MTSIVTALRKLFATVCLTALPFTALPLTVLSLTALPLTAQASETGESGETNDADELAQRNSSFLLAFGDEAWISEVGVLLRADLDADGFFAGFSLSLDADTARGNLEVFATIDITRSDSNFNNARPTRLFTTVPFILYGQSRSDEYRVDIDLLNNYNPDFYDLTVTLLDARDGQILDQVGANEFRNLDALPLESEEFDGGFVPVGDRPYNTANDDVVAIEYSGASGPLVLAVLLLSMLARIRRTQVRD